MTTIELKDLAHAKMVEAMMLLRTAHEMAEMEATNAEAKKCHAFEVLVHLEDMYPAYKGDSSFEADMDIAQAIYDDAWQKADLLRYDAEQIYGAMISARDAIDALEETWFYEELGR